MEALHWLGHLSYSLIALAYFMRDILWLRLIAITGSITAAMYFTLGRIEPDWVAFSWQFLFMAINGTWAVMLIRERAGVKFTDEERELFETVFQGFGAVEFMKLLRAGKWQDFRPGDTLTTMDQPVEFVSIIYDGRARVALRDGTERRLSDGTFIGEMTFIRGGNASATVVAETPLRCLVWDQEELRKLIARNPVLGGSLRELFSHDLTRKLTGGD